MDLSRVHRLMLFTLGSWCQQAGKKLQGRPLELAITKSVFISALIKAGIAGKTQRALYQNLEMLERKKFIDYHNHCLTLTARGKRCFSRICKQVDPFMDVLEILHHTDPLTYSKRLQTRLLVS